MVNNKFGINAIWNALGSIIYLAGQWLVTVLVVRFFGYTEAGILSLAMSITASFQTIAIFGIRNFQVSDIDNKYSDSCYVMLRNLTCLIALLACMIFTFINHYTPMQTNAIFLFMLFRLSEDYSDVLHGIAQKNGHLDIAGKGLALKGVLFLSVFMTGHYFGCGLNICLMMMAVSSWLVTLVFDLAATEKIHAFKLVCDMKKSLALCRETFPLCAYLFLSSTVTVIPKYTLEKLCDDSTLGIYSSISAPVSIIHAAATYIYMPFVGRFAEMFNEGKSREFLSLVTKIIFVLAGLDIICILAAAAAGEWALEFIYGKSILDYSDLLYLIIIATLWVAVASFVYMLEVVIRDFKNLITGCSIGFFSALFFSPVMIRLLGANGTSAGIIISAAGSVLYMLTQIVIIVRNKKSTAEET